ncbi:MAG: hypothetical protein ACM37W_26070 [Actinomycetota bacterium]
MVQADRLHRDRAGMSRSQQQIWGWVEMAVARSVDGLPATR